MAGNNYAAPGDRTRLVLFDVDGTLVDSRQHILEAQSIALARHGLPIPEPQRALAVVGLSLPEAFAALVGVDAPIAALSDAYREAWTQLRGRPGYAERLYPGAYKLLAVLAAQPRVRLGIASGKSRRGIERLLAAQGWPDLFATVQTADEHPSKPHPSMVLQALADTGIAANDAVMVGDTTFDVAMALAGGVPALGVTWGFHEADALDRAGAAAIVHDFDALAGVLRTWLDTGRIEAATVVSGRMTEDTRNVEQRAPIDPIAMARRDLTKTLPRRFYQEVGVAEAEGAFGPRLDGRAVRTPAKQALAVPTRALADAIAVEWREQGALIDPDTMPLTRLANSAIDGVAFHKEPTAAAIVKFAETDLVCYRASDPAQLVAEQAAAWDPVLAFARERFDARFVPVQGIIYVEQPESACAAVRDAVASVAAGPGGTLRIAALSTMTTLTGSVLIALAVAFDAMDVETAWAAAHVDEDYQMRAWGTDAEAVQRRERRWRDMAAAARLYALAGPRGI